MPSPTDFKLVEIGCDRKDEVSDFVNKYFTGRETLISKCNFSVDDVKGFMTKLTENLLRCGTSSAAIHVPTQEIAGVCLTKVLCKGVKGDFQGKETLNAKELNLLCILKCVQEKFDVFHCPKVDKVLNFVVTATNPKFSGNKIPYKLIEKCEELGKKAGCNVALAPLATGPAIQHIREKCGYSCKKKVYYNSIKLNDKPLDNSQGERGPYIGVFLKDLK